LRGDEFSVMRLSCDWFDEHEGAAGDVGLKRVPEHLNRVGAGHGDSAALDPLAGFRRGGEVVAPAWSATTRLITAIVMAMTGCQPPRCSEA
jgi:hypothetical protein